MDRNQAKFSKSKRVGKRIREGENPVDVKEMSVRYPEYQRARGTRWEDGGTILQA